jgi:SAM-dependent methyltransferase
VFHLFEHILSLGGSTSGQPLRLCAPDFRTLLALQGPSLGLWRAAEVAALREQVYDHPILDLGCGDGLVTSMVLSHVEVGLDPDTGALARAAQRGVYERFEAAPVEESRLPDASMGAVLSNSVLEHLPQLDRVLQTVARLLRPGGRLVCTVPTEAFSRWLLLPLPRYAAWRNRQLIHRNLWPVERWAWYLAQAGLELVAVRPYLRPELVRSWDALELLQQIWIGHRRVAGVVWQRIPPSALDRLAQWAARLDLAAAAPGGGRLIVARKASG